MGDGQVNLVKVLLGKYPGFRPAIEKGAALVKKVVSGAAELQKQEAESGISTDSETTTRTISGEGKTTTTTTTKVVKTVDHAQRAQYLQKVVAPSIDDFLKTLFEEGKFRFGGQEITPEEVVEALTAAVQAVRTEKPKEEEVTPKTYDINDTGEIERSVPKSKPDSKSKTSDSGTSFSSPDLRRLLDAAGFGFNAKKILTPKDFFGPEETGKTSPLAPYAEDLTPEDLSGEPKEKDYGPPSRPTTEDYFGDPRDYRPPTAPEKSQRIIDFLKEAGVNIKPSLAKALAEDDSALRVVIESFKANYPKLEGLYNRFLGVEEKAPVSKSPFRKNEPVEIIPERKPAKTYLDAAKRVVSDSLKSTPVNNLPDLAEIKKALDEAGLSHLITPQAIKLFLDDEGALKSLFPGLDVVELLGKLFEQDNSPKVSDSDTTPVNKK